MSAASSFAGKVVVITGASSGIGAATATHLAKLGALLSLNGRNTDNLQKVAQLCNTNSTDDGSKALIVVGDVTDEKANERLIDETIKKFGECPEQ